MKTFNKIEELVVSGKGVVVTTKISPQAELPKKGDDILIDGKKCLCLGVEYSMTLGIPSIRNEIVGLIIQK